MQQTEMWPPTWHTTALGNTVWIRYTHAQWMPARVVGLNRKRLLVQPLAGEIARVLEVAWGEVRWHPPSGALTPVSAT